MPSEAKTLKHWIDNFYGYGSWQARAWFIAHEDGGGDLPEEVAEKLNYFYQAHPPGSATGLCDMRELYQHASMERSGSRAGLYKTLFDYRFGKQATVSNVWKNLIAFWFAYQNQDAPDALAYQKKSLAVSSKKSEAMIKLYPLPSPNNHAWYYSWLDMPQLGFLKSRAAYQAFVYPTRMQTILQNLQRYKPELVLLYGMENINALKQSVTQFFPGARFKSVKAVKQHTPQYHITIINGTKLLITTQIPALRHNRMETGFDWEAFGKKVREED